MLRGRGEAIMFAGYKGFLVKNRIVRIVFKAVRAVFIAVLKVAFFNVMAFMFCTLCIYMLNLTVPDGAFFKSNAIIYILEFMFLMNLALVIRTIIKRLWLDMINYIAWLYLIFLVASSG